MPKSNDKNRRQGQGGGFQEFESNNQQRAAASAERNRQLEYQDKVLANHEAKEKRLLELEEKRLEKCFKTNQKDG